MPPKTSPHPFVLMRQQADGAVQPRFEPGPRERDQGFFGQDLKDGTGRWLTYEQACVWAKARHAEIVAARKSGKRYRPKAPRGRTIEDLLLQWHAALTLEMQVDPERISPVTLDGYGKQINAIIYKPQTRQQRKAAAPREKEEFALAPVAPIGKPEVKAFIAYQIKARGRHMGRASRAVLVQAFKWGEESVNWRLTFNPASAIRFKKPKGRIVIYDDVEIRALLAAAAALDRMSIGDGIVLGIDTTQRQRDRLLLVDEGFRDGRRHFRQSKNGRSVKIKETTWLRERLDDAKRRVAAIALRLGTRPRTVIVDETTGRPYNEHTYRHVFEDVRALAYAGSPELGLAPCPSLLWTDPRDKTGNTQSFKTDQDLRDTGITLLYRAGNSLDDIAEISGHSRRSLQTIIDHYLGADPERADAAIDRLEAFRNAKGTAV